MVPVITLVVTLAIALLVTRIAAVALTLTGLSQEVARFQARSAFSGVGFTTSEAESIMNHPVRRRIVASLMLMGNLGIAAMVASTIGSFAAIPSNDNAWIYRMLVLAGGVALVWAIGSSRFVDRWVSRAIEWALLKWTRIDVRDYVSLLHLTDGYVVLELQVRRDDWVVEKPLRESRLSKEGVLVLGIQRKSGVYIGSPDGNTMVRNGDTLTLYGPIERLEELDLRCAGEVGERAHVAAVSLHRETMTETFRLESPQPIYAESTPKQRPRSAS
ncbi:MAG: TrkA C-terminal domain-containing protein [Pirellulaceae bacterium]